MRIIHLSYGVQSFDKIKKKKHPQTLEVVCYVDWRVLQQGRVEK